MAKVTPVRVTVNLSPDTAQELKDMADKRGVKVTDIIRRAIATESYLARQMEENRLVLESKKNPREKRELVFTG